MAANVRLFAAKVHVPVPPSLDVPTVPRTLTMNEQALNWREWALNVTAQLADDLALNKPLIRICTASSLMPYMGVGGHRSGTSVQIAFWIRNVEKTLAAESICLDVNGGRAGCAPFSVYPQDAKDDYYSMDVTMQGTNVLVGKLIDSTGNVIAQSPSEVVVLQPNFERFLQEAPFWQNPTFQRHRTNRRRKREKRHTLLTALAQKHLSDKGQEFSFSTGNAYLYDQLWHGTRHDVLRVLELGVYQGASLKMWRDYFPRAQIYGIDINTAANFSGDRYRTFIGDACDRSTLEVMMQEVAQDGGPMSESGDPLFDFILEDSGHQVH